MEKARQPRGKEDGCPRSGRGCRSGGFLRDWTRIGRVQVLMIAGLGIHRWAVPPRLILGGWVRNLWEGEKSRFLRVLVPADWYNVPLT